MPVPTIEDVARAAGVSKTTVSRILSGEERYIRAETRARVQSAIERLAYRPSSVARSLTSKRTQTIAILISDVGNPFYADVIHGVEDIALKQGYQIFLCNTHYDSERGIALIRSLIDHRVDGVLLASSSITAAWVEELQTRMIPVVTVDWEPPREKPAISAIRVDYRSGIQEAVSHLIGLGHRRMAHVAGSLNLRPACDRRDAFVEALQQVGVEAPLILEGDFSFESGRKAGARIAALPDAARPTAVFAANDMMALGILAALRAAGLSVPQDVSVIGLDDIWMAAHNDPPLTTIALPRYQLGTQAATLLFELLARGAEAHAAPILQTITSSLVVRKSTAPPPVDVNRKSMP